MGLLSSSDGQRPRLLGLLQRYSTVLCLLLYPIGLILFAGLAWKPLNERTYFSDNSLLPGMVERASRIAGNAESLLESLELEVAEHPGLPTAWLAGEFRRAGLEVYRHNFSLAYPFGTRQLYHGENLYAIMRAPRTSRTEAIVISVPFRNSASPHGSTLASIAAVLDLAKHFRRQLYWSKDIIFVITEHELVGLQAWLDAYHLVETSPGVILPGYLEARSGSIMAAVNLELQDKHIDQEVSGTHGYYATPGSSTNRDRRPYESSYYEPIDYDDGYYQAEASGIQQQTAEQPPEGAGSGPSSKVRPSHAGHRGKIVNSAHEIDQIKASASEYYGGYGNGYGGGYDDFHHAYGGGSYHQVPYRPSHHRSSKGPLALLLGLLPLGLLFASLMPSFYNVPFAAIPPAGIAVQNIAAPPVAGRRRRDIHVDDAPKNNDVKPRSLTAMSSLQTTLTSVIESNPVIKVLQEYRLHGLNSPSCIQRLTCEILLTQPWMQTFAKSDTLITLE
ncbi:uncharacterized protein LOC111258803 isoform X3 [Varroa jacobsoni]|uniref:uncharacterized protein LOC111258803 isoform X3 n=1 Tax=Varroa jacobsoni TaxID=62625 RepID=UPI000BF69605|nr:uncharacterized protein LOC111258803 isoform X3 [Varroa jacobsoni]